MRRRPLTILSVVVLVMLCGLWVRSYRVTDDWFLIYRIDGSEQVSCSRGQWYVCHTRPNLGLRGGVERVSHRSVRTSCLLPWRLKEHWWVFPWDSVAALAPARVRQAMAALSAAHELERRWVRLAGTKASRYSDPEVQSEFAKLDRMRLANAWATPFLAALPSYWKVIIPMWVPMAAAAVLPCIWLIGWFRRRHLRRTGRCPTCRYNLTGNTSGVCPECGAAIAPAASS